MGSGTEPNPGLGGWKTAAPEGFTDLRPDASASLGAAGVGATMRFATVPGLSAE